MTVHPSAKVPPLYFERSFHKEEAKYYGISDDDFQKRFWGLRPDFMIVDKDRPLVILIDAKSGSLPPNTWTNPKERLYYQFLCDCSPDFQKGFYYIIPKKYKDDCKKCLAKHFASSVMVQTGFIFWDEVLPIIHDIIIKIALDQVIREMKGLEKLREWEGIEK